MMTAFTKLFTVVSLVVGVRSSKVFRFEAESKPNGHQVNYRSEASDVKAVWLQAGEELMYDFCLIRETSVTINNVRFSNDGGPDTCSVLANDSVVGQFQSPDGSDYGNLWNVFKSSGRIGSGVVMSAGWNTLKLSVTSADSYGIEIDYIDVLVDDDEVNDDIFTCILPCISDLPQVTAAKSGLTDGRAEQKSYATQCAEEDNVDVALFNGNVRKYEITAEPPRYRSFLNRRGEDTTNCPFITPVYWLYEDVDVSPTTKSLTSNTSHLYFSQKSAPVPYLITKMAVSFTLKGRKHGYIDSEIGSTLYMTLLSPDAESDVSVSYHHRNGTIIYFPDVTFSSSITKASWSIPDFTWKEDEINYINIEVKSTVINQELVNFRLERRYMGPDQVMTLYSSERVVLEGIKVDFWWQSPQSIQIVRSSTGDTWNGIAYFRFSVALPWADGYSQVFVLYQDGNMRLLYPTPHGVDWVPFGTSVILGQTTPTDFRPAVNVSRVDIEPEDLKMTLTYSDGSTTDLKLETSIEKTKLLVSNINFNKDKTSHPFATYRSMYVKAGNTDSDSIVSDASATKRILGGSWSNMTGTTFLLYRRCESKHLTQSPDIEIKITETGSGD